MVYFIQGEQTGLIKIGKAKNVQMRLEDLQVGSAERLTCLAVIEAAVNDTIYHARFRKYWIHGEWFEPAPELMGYIASQPKGHYTGMQPGRFKTTTYIGGIRQSISPERFEQNDVLDMNRIRARLAAGESKRVVANSLGLCGQGLEYHLRYDVDPMDVLCQLAAGQSLHEIAKSYQVADCFLEKLVGRPKS